MMVEANRLQHVEEYYFSRKLKEVAQLKAKGHPIINLAIGSPDLQPPPEVVEALVTSLTHPTAHKYQSYQGLPELREAMAQFYKKYYNVQANPNNNILPLIGSKEGIMHISMAFLNKGDEVLVPNPGYPTYTSVTNLVEATPIFYNLNRTNHWLPNLSELETLNLSKVKLMWLNYPHMPTGSNATATFFDELIAFGKRHNIIIVNDNPYSFILNKNPLSILSRPNAFEGCLELNSLSKIFNMAGWRVGMLLGNSTLVNSVLKVKSNMDSGMFYGIQKGAIAALNLQDNWFVQLNQRYQKRRELVGQLAEKLNCTYDKSATGLFVWAKLPLEKKAEEFTDHLLYHHHLFITPGTVFGSNGEGYIRFSLCEEEAIILEAINRL